ncbi:hypothetical protein JY651_03070 [Pyxidicoccus parkwayensis]|uniref:Uncharacterized protein n=1 Tax=Pyxidicoccus parkwayensis TaxID=2813578 RepID=A0ABX7P2J4_9BACT|nr:DUF5953 family protein [Pyxidicoccus parkwaysis]QSQ23978.1 hypothetical protein JY651_03070 [Pyxidicoccus parkwaysis]
MPPSPVVLSFTVPPLSPDDGRMSGVLRTLEELFPGVELGWRIEEEQGGPAASRPVHDESRYRQVRVTDRDAWLAECFRSGALFQVYSGPGQYPVNVFTSPGLRVRTRDGAELETVTVWLPQDDVLTDGRVEQVVARCGDALRAWHLAFMPLGTHGKLLPVLFSANVRLPASMDPRARLPALKALPRLSNRTELLPGPETPVQLGWLNYWSPETAQRLGFPDASRDGEWLARSTRTGSGAWVVKLTDAPLDAERPEDVEALVRAYERFDGVGVRV